MAYFQHVETRLDGPLAYASAITDLALVSVGGVMRLYAVTAQGGGLSVRSLDPGMAVLGSVAHPASVGLTALPQLTALTVAGQSLLVVAGLTDTGLRGYSIAETGLPGLQQLYTSGSSEAFSAFEAVQIGTRSFLLTAGLGGSALTSREVAANGTLTTLSQIAAGPAVQGLDIGAITHVEVGGAQLVLAVSAFQNRLLSFQITDGGELTSGSALGAAEGLGIAAPCVVRTVQMAGLTYALIGSAGSGTISVVRLSKTGEMTVTDNAIDSLDTRFQGIGALEVITVNGRTYVIAGGGDDGLTLLALLPTGRLLHLETIPDTAETALSNISALVARWTGTAIEVFAAGRAEAGIGRFRIDIGTPAPMLLGGAGDDTLTGDARADLIDGRAGNDLLSGGAGDDILIDGAGSDVLYGGAGADTFVMAPDAAADQIGDFRLSEDRLDLSAWGLLYDVGQLDITSTATGAVIRFGDEVLTLITDTGTSLNPAALTNAHIVNLQHTPGIYDTPPEPDPQGPTAGTTGSDSLTGGIGDDTLLGLDGNDWLSGEDGADLLEGADGADQLFGGSGADTLDGGVDNDALAGGGDDDFLDGGSGLDQVHGEDGDDRLAGGTDADSLFGGLGDDVLSGDDGDDLLDPGMGSDTIFGGAGADTFRFVADGRADQIGDFQLGSDRLDLTGWGPIFSGHQIGFQATATGAILRYGTETLTLISSVGLALNLDEMVRVGAFQVWTGLLSVAGGTLLKGSRDSDLLTGTDAADHLQGLGRHDTLRGMAGDDILNGSGGRDVLDGGEGQDIASYLGGKGGLLVDLANPLVNTGKAFGDKFTSIENIYGSVVRNDLRGDAAANMLDGGIGDDVLDGRIGDDTLIGGPGDDLLIGGAGQDLLIGGAGRDIVQYSTSLGGVWVDLLTPALNQADAAGDRFDGIENLGGSAFADHLSGDHFDNWLAGLEGADLLFGRGGNDHLFGGSHSDTLDGGDGNDVLTGRGHADTFLFNAGQDVIEDFNAALGDRIGIDRALLSDGATTAMQLAQLATLNGAMVQFDFGSGHSLTLLAQAGLAGLADALFVY